MIRSLNLDGMFVPTSQPEIEFEMIQFNGGEMHIKLNNNIDYSEVEKVVITNRFKNGDDIIKVLITKDALQRKGVKNFDLVMPYVPYARQDRQCFNGESFTLKVFTDLINSAKFDNVIVLDSHSDVAPALIENCKNINNESYVNLTYSDIVSYSDVRTGVVLISPDSGANKKTNKLFENLKVFKALVKCDKKRDVSNGNLSGFEVFADDLKGACCLIVDDICDGGRTFTGVAEALKAKNAGNIYLFVTHGIFSNGFDELNKYFKVIYTTNSFKDVQNSNVKQFKIQL
jgi:ribose-phosphate pyrophosphokinase